VSAPTRKRYPNPEYTMTPIAHTETGWPAVALYALFALFILVLFHGWPWGKGRDDK
jgi:hypothetical protein